MPRPPTPATSPPVRANRTGSAQSAEPPWARLRGLFPVGLLLVVAGFVVGIQVRARWGLFSAQDPGLSVQSDPEGASVFLNGRLAGATPLRIAGLLPGEYALRLEKADRQTVTRRVTLAPGGLVVSERLPAVPVRRLKVEVEPRGAEVLLDGALLGCTPLTFDNLPAGQHELVIRKTNFEAQIFRIQVKPDEEEVITFSGFALRDKILALLRRQVEGEPYRIGHCVDLGHYLFVNGDLEEAAKEYCKALVLSSAPLKLPEHLPPEEREVEQQLRGQDVQRLNDELRKKQNWAGKDVTVFRAMVEQAQAQLALEHLDDWAWVKQAAENLLRDKRLERAEDLYSRHIGAAAQSPELPQAFLGLLTVRLRMHNLSGVRETFTRFVETYGKRPDLLLQAGQAVLAAHPFYRDQELAEVLGMAERALRAGLEGCPPGEPRAKVAAELAVVLERQERYVQALAFYRQAAEGTADEALRETRLLEQAACLVRMKSLREARALYERLAQSPREGIARQAAQRLQALDKLDKLDKLDNKAK